MTHEAAFEQELGTFIGPATTAKAIKALDGHTPGEWVVQLLKPGRGPLWRKHGWSWHLVQNKDQAVFAITTTGPDSGNPSLFMDAPIVLTFSKRQRLISPCELYSGGLVFTLTGPGFGRHQGHTLTLITWHGVLHVTQSGEVAPGLGLGEIR